MKPSGLEEELQQRFSEAVEPLETPFEIPQYRVSPDTLRDVLVFLKDKGFAMLVDLGGVDYLPRSPRFEVVYHLQNLKTHGRIRLRCCPEDDENPVVPSIHDLWPAANPAEREVYDLFGVQFSGHPNLSRILLPDDWEGHPLRKDYPLRGPREELEARYAAEKNRYHAPKVSGE